MFCNNKIIFLPVNRMLSDDRDLDVFNNAKHEFVLLKK